MFESLFDISSTSITLIDTVVMIIFGLISGIIISFTYMHTYRDQNYNSNFALTMVLLPLVVSLLIMLIGSDIAAAFSLAGAFSIIRFRSAPGEPKDIAYVLFAMMAGLASGVGAKGYTVIFTIILCIVMFALFKLKYGEKKNVPKEIKITIPEDLNYTEAFKEVFESHNINYSLSHLKSTSLGSLYQLTYKVRMPEKTDLEKLINDIRVRNSNLNISINLVENTDY
ncbi:DUF4956 domain-containing protein [Mariniplasma anaerobium]|uniref:DUF4956 domain-containing protein n=1 Tax=Mariniplasma anaerobium TaxID=2735436 RepID=A0A7U9XVR3_9MOLU|nr:DUF4956 domain-containing protein [Mariniplasma anaerobium]BCR36655.1 DUF4956 domain-containing protein [Mariniplasma anaerobium]